MMLDLRILQMNLVAHGIGSGNLQVVLALCNTSSIKYTGLKEWDGEEKAEGSNQFIKPQLVITTLEYGRLKPLSATTARLSPINFATLYCSQVINQQIFVLYVVMIYV